MNNLLLLVLSIVVIGIIFYYFYPSGQNSDPTLVTTYSEPFNSQSKGEIVLYSASWCGVCKSFMPEWNNFSSYAQTNMPFIKVTNMVCEDGNEAVCSQKNIEGYPTVRFYKPDGKEVQYEGDRTSTSLIKFVNACI